MISPIELMFLFFVIIPSLVILAVNAAKFTGWMLRAMDGVGGIVVIFIVIILSAVLS